MKFTNCVRGFAVLGAFAVVPCVATAAPLTSFTTAEGVAPGDTNVTGSAVLTSISVGATTYFPLSGAGIIGGSSAETLHANTLSAPASASAAVSDLNIATGTLNTNALYDISAATSSDVIFVIGNGNGSVSSPPSGSGGTTPPGTLQFFAADGTTLVGTLAQDVAFQDPGANTIRAANLASFDFTRGNGNALNGRTVSGFVFSLTEISLESGFTVDDIVGVNLNTGFTDVQDIGIAAVPEPASAAWLAASGLFLLRRRRGA